jgi:uncharacterized protein YdeI (YjbR/CyaY-like superfamily)
MEPMFFATPAQFGAWLEEHHADATELRVGFHRKATGRPSITWPEAVDEALCFGWIDGHRRGLDGERYEIRFTPRAASSTWSAVNVARVEELRREGRMRPAGLAAFERRSESRTGTYSYEQRAEAKLTKEQERAFRANGAAWEFFQHQPPWYRRTATYWVVSAKKEETRAKRLATLIDDSAHARPIRQLIRRRGP